MAQWDYLVRVFALDKDEEVVVDYVDRGVLWKVIRRMNNRASAWCWVVAARGGWPISV